MYTYAEFYVEVWVDVKCQRMRTATTDSTRVTFTRTQMRPSAECGHVFTLQIAPGHSLNVACDVLERNPFVAIGPRER